MIKKILISIFIFILALFISVPAFCEPETDSAIQESSKITGVSFDNSDKIIFLSAKVPNNTVTPPNKIRVVKLSDPDRIFFDLPNAVLTMKNTAWVMQNSVLKEVKVAQTSTSPDIVRVVLTSDNDLSQIFVMQIPSGYIIRYSSGIAMNDYLSEFYRDSSASQNDYYEKTVSIDKSIFMAQSNDAEITKKVDETFDKINKSFQNTTPVTTAKPEQNSQAGKAATPVPAQNLSVSNNVSRIKTKYYLNRLDIKRGNILISGIGSASLEKVKILTEPSRLVFDMPNAVLNPDLRNNEYKISETETVRLGQFEQSKVRIVINTPDTSKYKPIFSQDMQGILFAHDDRLENIRLFDKTTTIQSYNVKHTNNYDLLTLNLSEPVIQSVVRDYNKVNLTVYNAKPVADGFFTNNLKSTMFKDLKISKISKDDKFQAGQVFTIPVDKYDTVYIYEAQNGKQLVIKIEPQHVIEKNPPKHEKEKKKHHNTNIKGLIIIDPGHGGPDVGATRNNIFEKDINLDVAKRVYNILTKAGYKVEMTRDSDVNPTLQERCDFSNEKNAILFVSIHTNASVNEAPNGIETHFYKDDSIELSNIVHKHLISETKAYNRGTIKSMFYVINHTRAPSILVEMGYISNDKEREELLTETRKENTARAVAEGIIEYLKEAKTNNDN